MSAETGNGKDVENKPEDAKEAGAQREKFGLKCLKKNWQLCLKILQLALSLINTAMIVDPINKARLPNNNMHHVAIIFTAFAGYLIIGLVLCGGRLLKGQVSWITSALFSAGGAFVNLAAGIVLFMDWDVYMSQRIYRPRSQHLHMFCVSAIVAIVNCLLFVIDFIFTVLKKQDFY